MIKSISRRLLIWKGVLLSGDILCYFFSVVLALYFNSITSKDPFGFLLQFIINFLLVATTYFIVLYIADMYDQQRDFRRPLNNAKLALSCWIGTAAVMIIFYFPFGSFVGRYLLIIQALAFSSLICLWRFAFSTMALPHRLQINMLIIGAGKSGKRLLNVIRKREGWGVSPVGFIDDDPPKTGTIVDGLPVLGNSSHLEELLKKYGISLMAVAITHEKSPQLINSLIKASWSGCRLIDMPTLYELLTGMIPTSHISENWLFQWNLNNSKIYYRRIKRIMDFMGAIFFSLISLPLFAMIPLLIKIDSPGPILFRQRRLGQGGRPFNILKYRTMVQGSEANGPLWTSNNDSRITRMGKILRRTRLDELPQLINIIRGEMSVIGPRPLVHSDLNKEILYYNYRLLAKPGLTGWAQVMFPNGLTPDTNSEKIKYDLYYVKNMSLILDIAIILKTVRIVLLGKGI